MLVAEWKEFDKIYTTVLYQIFADRPITDLQNIFIAKWNTNELLYVTFFEELENI